MADGFSLGEGTVETRTIPEALQVIDSLTLEDDLLAMYCDGIVHNKSIGIYDGAYKSVALATGTEWERPRSAATAPPKYIEKSASCVW